MARLLVDWLNNEVKLSRQVTSLDSDFRDGYLIGELLHNFNQQPDFNEFVENGNADSKVRNFCLLERTMRKIGVHYNSRIAQDIMAGKPAVMKTLLYEIRTTLDVISKRSVGVKPVQYEGEEEDRKHILRVIQPSRPLYDKTMSVTFENAIRAMMENPNEVLMAEATKRFRERKQQLRMSASVGHEEQLDAMRTDLQRRKAMDRQRRVHEMEFQVAWDLRNREQWQQNQTIARDRRALEQKVYSKARDEEAARVEGVQRDARESTLRSIDDFEAKLKSSIFRDESSDAAAADAASSMLKTIGGNPGTGIPELTYLDQSVLSQNLVQAQKTIKEHHQDIVQHQQLHNRRRRKFVRENEFARTTLLQKTTEEAIVAQILQPCISESVERYECQRVKKHIRLIDDNQQNRKELLASVLQADDQRDCLWKEQEAHHELHWVVAQRLSSQYVRAERYEEAIAAAIRFDALAIMQSEVARILDLADWVISCREFGVLSTSKAEVEEMEADAQLAAAEEAAAAAAAAAVPEKGGKGARPASSAKAGTPTQVPPAPAPSDVVVTSLLPDPLWKVVKTMYTSKFNLSETLPAPQAAYVYDKLPNSLSLKPLCLDIGTLLQSPFKGKDLFAAKVDAITSPPAALLSRSRSLMSRDMTAVVSRTGSFDETHSGDMEEERTNHSGVVSRGLPDKLLYDFLASSDAAALLAELLSNESLGGDSVVEVPPREDPTAIEPPEEEGAPMPLPKTFTVAPDVYFQSAPKYLLGELLLDVSCTHNPLELDPEPDVDIDLTTMPLKLALAGPSDVGKSAIAARLREALGVKIINCEELIHEALVEYDALVAERGAAVPVGELAEEEGGDIAEEGEKEAHFRRLEALRNDITSGSVISDDTYVHLIVKAINRLQEELSQQKALLDSEGDAAIASMMSGEEGPGNAEDEVPSLDNEDPLVRRSYSSASTTVVPHCPGFVIEDFPSTEKQALLLFQALSGYDYAKSRPQPVDRASKYAPPVPCKRVDYDISKCGLDAVYYVDAAAGSGGQHAPAPGTVNGNIDLLLQERIAMRVDVNHNGDQIYLDDAVKSVVGIVEPYEPLHCVHTCGIDVCVVNHEAATLKAFLTNMNLLRERYVTDPASIYAFADEIVTELSAAMPATPVSRKRGNSTADILVIEDGNEGVAAAAAASASATAVKEEPAAAAAEAAPTDEAAAAEAAVPAPLKNVIAFGKLPVQLAGAMSAMWTAAEKTSDDFSCSFSMALREIKFQLMQRRRGIHDVVQSMLTKLDGKQTMLEEFREQFNAFELDTRFDPDCQRELHLRTMELRDTFWELSEARAAAADAYVTKMSSDCCGAVLELRSQTEGAAMVQSEVNRYLCAIHIIIDAAKAMGKFSANDQLVLNELEETLPVSDGSAPVESKGGKGGAKGGKDAKGGKGKGSVAFVPFRAPVASLVLNAELASDLPSPAPVLTAEEQAEAAAAAAKAAKGKGAAKGGDAGGVKETPLEAAIRAAMELSDVYAEDSFTLNRELYRDDEALCIVVEHAVWYETRKLRQSLDNVKALVAEQVSLIRQMEKDVAARMRRLIKKQQLTELSVCERIVAMIQEHIVKCEPIVQEWLVAPDAIAICSERIVYRPPEPDPTLCR